MKYSEACPKCGSEEYEINDYGDSFDQFGAEQWWECTCTQCETKFHMLKMYKLVNVSVEEGELV
jgi:predicted nucleic-acid-binding Zn-ribbon protein